MQEIVYHTNYELEDSYWWFLARNVIVRNLIFKFCSLKSGDEVLDVGCGTGGFAKFLSEYYDVLCLDTSSLALEYCSKRGLKKLYNMTLGEFPKSDNNIKAILMLDVVEHIEDDNKVIKEVFDALPSNGYFISTVPSYQWLWSKHDEIHLHYRRYNKNNYNELLLKNGFQIDYSSYYNFLLFFPAVIKRLFDKILKIKDNNKPIDEMTPMMNRIFHKIFSFEEKLLGKISLPFGLSIITIARKV